MGVLMKSLFQNYEALRAGRTPANGQGKPYSDYIKWLGKQDNEEAESYWSERLAGFEQPSVLPGRLPLKKTNTSIKNIPLHGTKHWLPVFSKPQISIK